MGITEKLQSADYEFGRRIEYIRPFEFELMFAATSSDSDSYSSTSTESEENSDLMINLPFPQGNDTAIRQRPQTETEESEEDSDLVITLASLHEYDTIIRQRSQTETEESGEDSDLDLPPQQRNGQIQQQNHQNHNAEHLFPALENLAIQQQNNSSFRPLP